MAITDYMKRKLLCQVNEGLHIKRSSDTVDVIVRGIKINGRNKAAALEFKGNTKCREIYLSRSDGLWELANGISIGVGSEKTTPNKISLHYELYREYAAEKRKYE